MFNKLLPLSLLLSAATQGGVLINEVDSDNPSTDTAEFIELYDGGSGNTPLDDYTLVLFNGNGDTSYKTIDLTNQQTNADGFFVVCGDAANVPNCQLDISPNSNLVQNGADAVALYHASASDFPNGSSISTTALIDAIAYDTNDSDDAALLALLNADQPQVNEGGAGDKDNHSNQRCGEGIARNTDGYVQTTPTPGMANACGGDEPQPPVLGNCGDTDTEGFHVISQIQGDIQSLNDDASPLVGQVVVVEAIVTTDLQGGTLANGDSSYQYSGYWLQEELVDQDASPATSEGVFVYDFRSDVTVGDKVRLMGTVGEFNQVTQLSNITNLTVCAQNQTLPPVTTIQLPVSELTEWEALEGMLVTNNQNLLVSDLFGTGYGFGNYGQFVVSSQLHYQPTEIALPGSAQALAAKSARPLDVLLVDDGVSSAYPSFIPFPDETGFSASNPMRIGYAVPELTGVLHAFRSNYQVIPSAITIDPVAPRTAAPEVDNSANVIIVGMNVLNYFNGDGQGGGFPTSRGAPTAEAFAMQDAKIVSALVAMDADIIGLMEIENDGYGEFSAIQDLLRSLNAQQAVGDEYSFIQPNVAQIGTDEISVGLLYRGEKVLALGETVILDSSNSPLDENGEPLFIDTKNRPALIQSFEKEGVQFTVAVNHFKSKGSACNEINEGMDGQGNCNVTRTKAAQALATFLTGYPTGIETDETLILGDLNAYSQEDPMQVLYENGYENLKYTDKSTESKPFSYSFSGFLGSLDHAVASQPLVDRVVSVDAWHINSVEAPLVDYLTEENGQPYRSVDHYAEPDAYRSSDHDPIVVGLSIEGAGGVLWLLVLAPVLLLRRK